MYGVSKTQDEINAGKNNKQFEDYYKGLGILTNEDDWDQFYSKLKEPLDICFRVNSVDKYKDRTMAVLMEKVKLIKADPELSHKIP